MPKKRTKILKKQLTIFLDKRKELLKGAKLSMTKAEKNDNKKMSNRFYCVIKIIFVYKSLVRKLKLFPFKQ